MKDLRLTIAKLLAPIKVTIYDIPVTIPAPDVVEVGAPKRG